MSPTTRTPLQRPPAPLAHGEPPGPPGAGTRLALLAALLLAACAEDVQQGDGVRELLDQPPHVLLDQPGLLVPRARSTADEGEVPGPFGRLARGGWARELDTRFDRPVAWSRNATTRLVLPALEPRARTLVLELACASEASARAREVSLFLNGTELGALELSSVPVPYEVEAPEEVWRRGDNVLEIRAPELVRSRGWGLVGVGLSGLRYDFTRRVPVAPGEAELKPGTAIGYEVEVGREAQLDLKGLARGRGVLEVDVRRLTPEGEVEETPLVSERVHVGDERLERAVPLQARAGDLLRIEVGLVSGSPGARLHLERVALVEHPEPRPPSIVLVSVDGLAARESSLFGNPRATTPGLQALAKEAVLFVDCRANAPWGTPSHMSELTGLYPRSHELEGSARGPQSEWERRRIAASRWTLAEALRARGYRTAAFVDSPWLARGLGFEQGFQHFDTSATRETWRDPEGGLDHMLPRIRAWLAGLPKEEPFFLYVQSSDLQAPYNPMPPWKDAFEGDGLTDCEEVLPVGHGQRWANGCLRPVTVRALLPDPLPDVLPAGPVRTAFHEKLLQADDGLRRLVRDLRGRKLLDTSVLVVVGAHGESTGRHDLWFGHGTLYEDVVRVPLLVRMPRGEHGGALVPDPVQSVDLYPTLLQLSGSLQRPEVLHGGSIRSLLRGQPLQERPIYGEGGLCRQAFLHEAGWKLVVSFPSSGPYDWMWTHPRLDRERLRALAPDLVEGWPAPAEIEAALDSDPELARFLEDSLRGPVFELYHVDEDPDEQVDLAAERPDVVQRLYALLIEERLRGERARSGGQEVTAPEWTEAERLRFEALGYQGD